MPKPIRQPDECVWMFDVNTFSYIIEVFRTPDGSYYLSVNDVKIETFNPTRSLDHDL